MVCTAEVGPGGSNADHLHKTSVRERGRKSQVNDFNIETTNEGKDLYSNSFLRRNSNAFLNVLFYSLIYSRLPISAISNAL